MMTNNGNRSFLEQPNLCCEPKFDLLEFSAIVRLFQNMETTIQIWKN